MFLILLTTVFGPILSLIIYRLHFHPLASYPGPFIGRITDWYSVYHCLKGDRYLDFMALHTRYGSVVRYGPNRLSFSTADALQAIYGTHANTKKSYWYETMTFYMKVPSTHATTNKSRHARKRRILAQALSDRMVHVYEDGFRTLLADFLPRYEAPASEKGDVWSSAFDMAHEFMLLNFDSMGKFCFGESFGALQDPTKAEITENSLKGFRWLNAVGHIPVLYWLKIDALPSKTTQALYEYENYAAVLADRRAEKMRQNVSGNEPLSCVFDILHATCGKEDVEGFSYPELKSESSLLVTTGTDTASGTLANLVFHLLNHPTAMHALTKEIRDTFTNIAEIRTGKALNSCKLLTACIDETLRLSPIIGGCLMREVGPGGTSIDGHLIPAGVDVGVPFHVIMRNPKYYEAPLEFRPQRWLSGETPPEEIKVARAAFCPFGVGPTGCVGKSWALVEMKMTLAQLLFRYDMQKDKAEGEDHLSVTQRLQRRERDSLDRFVITNKGPFVKFRLARGG